MVMADERAMRDAFNAGHQGNMWEALVSLGEPGQAAPRWSRLEERVCASDEGQTSQPQRLGDQTPPDPLKCHEQPGPVLGSLLLAPEFRKSAYIRRYISRSRHKKARSWRAWVQAVND